MLWSWKEIPIEMKLLQRLDALCLGQPCHFHKQFANLVLMWIARTKVLRFYLNVNAIVRLCVQPTCNLQFSKSVVVVVVAAFFQSSMCCISLSSLCCICYLQCFSVLWVKKSFTCQHVFFEEWRILQLYLWNGWSKKPLDAILLPKIQLDRPHCYWKEISFFGHSAFNFRPISCQLLLDCSYFGLHWLWWCVCLYPCRNVHIYFHSDIGHNFLFFCCWWNMCKIADRGHSSGSLQRKNIWYQKVFQSIWIQKGSTRRGKT